MLKYFLLSLLLALSLSLDGIEAQDDQPGYISIDCGWQGPNYTDHVTFLRYTSDDGFVDTGVSQSVEARFQTDSTIEEQFKTLRHFPNGSRNCYTLRPVRGRTGKYLIRAWFMYGDYDEKNQPPKFDLHIGNQYWETVTILNASRLHKKEIIHTPSQDHIHVCLVKTGPGIPFISTLELRPLDIGMYPIKKQNVSLNAVVRINMNPTENGTVRFSDDIYDRLWTHFPLSNSRTLSSTSPVDNRNDFLKVPSKVMTTAAEAITSGNLSFYWDAAATAKYYMFLHFVELDVLETDQIRAIDIYLNDEIWYEKCIPSYLSINTIYYGSPATGKDIYIVTVAPNPATTLPPTINAAEVYSLVEFPLKETFDGDVAAMVSIKTTYKLTENWQGDPCGPQGFQWNGVNCTNNDGLNHPKIISLNLASKRLSGSIAPAIFDLKALQTLDLSDNSLTGQIPDFLAKLDSLTVLNLRGNNFSGSCPPQLLEKANTGKLNLVPETLCGSGSSTGVKTKKKVSVLPIGAAAGGVFIIIFASSLVFYIMKGHKNGGKQAKAATGTAKRFGVDEPNLTPCSDENQNFIVANKGRQFTYHEVLEITNNFQAVIGKGGFGTVYHGYVGEAQVAVKMLSASSSQGYKEFQAEARLLLTIHHKNLTSLVGYCHDGTNMAIIYDYMPNGSMEKHLIGNGPYVLTFEERLQMAIDTAQGLEYLHHGCKPPIVHRDIKITNILVDEKFGARLADFGLSRAFSIEDDTHVVSTAVTGTPGYLDPEYYSTGRLTEKSDIYSFGIVLLEVVTGCPALPRNNEMPHIITWVGAELEKGDLEKIIDPKLRGDYAVNSPWKVLEIAMSCVARNSVKRPTMNFVVTELKACLTMSQNETELKASGGFISSNMNSGFNPQAR